MHGISHHSPRHQYQVNNGDNQTRLKTLMRQTIYSILLNLFLSALKIVFGLIARSHALVADGLHSLSDLLTDGLVIIAAKAGDKKADREHPYGHRRIETVGSQFISWILIAAGIAFAWETLNNWIQHPVGTTKDTLVIVIAAISVASNEIIFRVMRRAAQKTNSSLLMSNALHHRSDALTSVIVVISAVVGLFTPWRIDAIAAIIIAVMIIKMGAQIAWNSIQELIDKAVDDDTLQLIKNAIGSTSGVNEVHQLRTRLYSGDIFIDVHVIVDHLISVSEGHHIGERVEENIKKALPAVKDVTVHIDPEDDESNKPSAHLPHRESIVKKVAQSCAQLKYYNDINHMQIHYHNGEIYLIIYIATDKIKHQMQLEQDYLHNIQAIIPEINHLELICCKQDSKA